MSTYLAAHPEANEDLTEIAKQPMDEAQIAYRAYFADNPQVETESEGDQQARCRPDQPVRHRGSANTDLGGPAGRLDSDIHSSRRHSPPAR